MRNDGGSWGSLKSPTQLYRQIIYTANIDGVRSWAVLQGITVVKTNEISVQNNIGSVK